MLLWAYGNSCSVHVYVAGGGGGTRGHKDFSYHGRDASLEPNGTDGLADNPFYFGKVRGRSQNKHMMREGHSGWRCLGRR